MTDKKIMVAMILIIIAAVGVAAVRMEVKTCNAINAEKKESNILLMPTQKSNGVIVVQKKPKQLQANPARSKPPTKSGRVKDTKTASVVPVSWSMKCRVVYRKLRNYGPCELCCPKWWRWRKTCYTQRKLMPGDKVMATDGSLPVGARIFIPALMEIYTVEDKGTVNELFVYDKRDGLGIKRRYPYSHAAAREFGVQELELWILED